jgi:hypothetical protein
MCPQAILQASSGPDAICQSPRAPDTDPSVLRGSRLHVQVHIQSPSLSTPDDTDNRFRIVTPRHRAPCARSKQHARASASRLVRLVLTCASDTRGCAAASVTTYAARAALPADGTKGLRGPGPRLCNKASGGHAVRSVGPRLPARLVLACTAGTEGGDHGVTQHSK